MTKQRQQHGFTLIELMIVVAIIGILSSIAVPNFLRFQARARQSEANTNLKSLFTTLRTQQSKPPSAIRSSGFSPERGNRYSYHLEDGCSSFEDRGSIDAAQHDEDTCIGVDRFKYTSFPDFFTPMPVTGPMWNSKATANTLATNSGIFGTTENWDFLAYAAGDVDNIVGDVADTWLIASSDGLLSPACPAMADRLPVSAGEPFNVSNDVQCD